MGLDQHQGKLILIQTLPCAKGHSKLYVNYLDLHVVILSLSLLYR